MKNLLVIALFLGCAMPAFAQVPQGFNYQTVVRDNNGQPLVNTPVNFRISIVDFFLLDTTYVEIHYKQTNQFGLVAFQVGGGNVQKGNFMNINWAVLEMHMLVETDVNGSGTYNFMGDTRLLSVPYAMVAGKVLENPNVRNNQFVSGYFFTTTTRNADVMTGDSVVVAKSGTYLITADATGYGIVYNLVTNPNGDNDVRMKIFRNGFITYDMPLHDYKKDDGYPTVGYNLTPRQSSLLRTVYLNQGDVISTGIYIGTYGSTPNTSALGYLNYELNLIKID